MTEFPQASPSSVTTAGSTTPRPDQARGILAEKSSDGIVLTIPGTDYRLHLGVLKAPAGEIGKRISGTIRVEARRIDIVWSGGRYIEPVYGPPRRIQGEVIAADPTARSLTIHAGVPIIAKLMKSQSVEQFTIGDFVSFDAMPGAGFTPA